MDKNICEICGTENEQEYKYCKNCGGVLDIQEKKETVAYNSQPNYTYTAYNPNQSFIADSFEGVSSEEMVAFVGKNSDKILPKFSKMEFTRSKVSWCWPAAILGYLLGPMGSALWFFYRKMYKPAVIFAVIGAVITILTGVMSVGDDIIPEAAIDAFISGNYSESLQILENSQKDVTVTEKVLIGVSSLINEMANIGACIISGIYGFYNSKKHCINKIREVRSYQGDARFYKLGLASVGGCSGGMLALGIILIFASQSIVEFINAIVSLLF